MSDLNRVFVVPVNLEKHPNADSLSIVRVFDYYTVVVRTNDWRDKTRGAWIPPDNVVPDNEFFSFLKGKTHIKECKLRGVLSQGLLVPVPENFNVGDDVTEYFGVVRYVNPNELKLNITSDIASPPPQPGPMYDLESWFKYGKLIPFGTPVVITEKIDGTSSKYTFQMGEIHVSSRNNYRKRDPKSVYWKALELNPWIEEFCRTHEGVILYGEVFGNKIQKLNYDKGPGEIEFRAFDVYDPKKGVFWGYTEFISKVTENGRHLNRVVPILDDSPYSEELVLKHISGKSTLASHNREGIVIRPKVEMYHDSVGRLVLKAVSDRFFK